jgi:hypothetical protein
MNELQVEDVLSLAEREMGMIADQTVVFGVSRPRRRFWESRLLGLEALSCSETSTASNCSASITLVQGIWWHPGPSGLS